MFNHNLSTRPNGLTLIRVPMPAVSSVTALLFVNTGSRFESKKWWGIAHFLEHMVFKGSPKYPTAQKLAGAVDSVGANFNAFTSHEYTGYYVKSASSHLGLSLDVLSDMILVPNLKQEDIDREKGVIIEEMNMYVDTPTRYVGQIFQHLVFDEKSLGHDIIGTKESVSALSRQDFVDFMNDWYGYENLILVLAGDEKVVSDKETLKLVDEYFSKGDGARHSKKAKELLGTSPLTESNLHVQNKATEQAHFILGFPAFSCFDDRRYALSLLGTVLGGNMSSRLFSEVREKRGLCYYVHSDVDLFLDSGTFGASAGVDPKRVDEAIKVSISEFYSILDRSKNITSSELKSAKDYISGKFVLDLEDSESVAQFYGMRQLVHGQIQTPEEVLAKYQKVTLEQIEAVVKEVIKPDNLRFALLGPFEDQSRFQDLLKSLG